MMTNEQIKGKNSLPLNPFLFAFYLNKIRSFGFWAFTPNPSAQNPKRKKKFENFLKQFRLLSEKRKGIHQLTRHIWLRLFTKASTHICLRYATANIRYAETLSKMSLLSSLDFG